jgi:O-antigen/teichoic acid export membrane protein
MSGRASSFMRRMLSSRLGGTMTVFIGNGLSAGMGFLILAFLARNLPPSEFGTLSPIIAILDTGQLLIDAVLVLGMLHVASKHATTAPAVAAMALKIGLWTKLAAGIAICILGLIASRWLSVFLLESPEWRDEFMLMFIAITPASIYTFVTSVLQTQERFTRLAVVSLYKNGFRLLCIGGVFLMGALDATSIIWAFTIAAVASAALAITAIPARTYLTPGIDRTVLKDVFSINKWMVLLAIGFLGARVDILMLTRMSTADEVAWYTAAFQLCTVFGILSQALVTTLFPKTSKISTHQEVRQHVMACLKYVPIALAFGLIAALAGKWLIPLLLGEAYAAASGVFSLLLFSSLVTLLINPIMLVFFPMNWSSMFGMASLLQLLLRIGLNLALIAPFGAIGAGIADVASKLVVIAGMLVAVNWRMKQMERESAAG